MITFTKEQLIASAHARIEFAEMMLAGDLEPLKERTWSIELELARIALASLEAEPVPGLFIKCTNIEPRPGEVTIAQATPMADGKYHDSCFHLYSAPPAPVSDSLLSEILAIAKKAADAADECAHAEFSDDSMEHSAAIADWERRAAMLQGSDEKPELTVWYGSMPETNGKANWTAILHRKGEGRCMDGFTIDRSEYPGRVLYAADRVRYLIGEKSERPSILDYDADAHSGYVKTGNSPVIPYGWVLVPVEPTMAMLDEFDSIIDYGAEDSKEAWSRLIATVPQQEVK